ncbi:MAG: hypothetical protein ACFFBU_04890 [Promethearchaeota archaeon]
MSDSSLLAAVGIVLNNKKLLVLENSDGQLDLPGFILADEEKVAKSINEFIHRFNLDGQPQQTLYLTAIRPSKSAKKKVSAIVQFIHLKTTHKFDISNTWFEPLTKLLKDKRVAPLTRIVIEWLTSN